MGMGFSGAYAEVIEPDKLAEIAPASWSEVLKLLTEDVTSQDLFLTVMAHLWIPDMFEDIDPDWLIPDSTLWSDDEDTVNQRIAQYALVFDKLRNEFTNATKVGESTLELDMDYHDSDSCGDRYDEVSGPYFQVHGCYEPTPAAKDLIKNSIVERRWFVVLG